MILFCINGEARRAPPRCSAMPQPDGPRKRRGELRLPRSSPHPRLTQWYQPHCPPRPTRSRRPRKMRMLVDLPPGQAVEVLGRLCPPGRTVPSASEVWGRCSPPQQSRGGDPAAKLAPCTHTHASVLSQLPSGAPLRAFASSAGLLWGWIKFWGRFWQLRIIFFRPCF